jgi:hypothetical protein
MDRICYYLINYIDSSNVKNILSYSTMENGSEMDMSIDEQCIELENILGDSVSNIEKYYNNWGCQRRVIISFVFKGMKCNICEHFGSQRDYLCVKTEPVINIPKSYLEALISK